MCDPLLMKILNSCIHKQQALLSYCQTSLHMLLQVIQVITFPFVDAVFAELIRSGSLLLSNQESETTQECGEENHSVKEKSRTKQESFSQAARKKTWPERRRERREVKRLRREAQARREGGLFGGSRRKYDEEVFSPDPFRTPSLDQRKTPPPLQMKKWRGEEKGRRSRKSREAERWKKRGGLKHGDLHPYSDIDNRSENLLSPKQRVRHRRK